MIVKVRMYKNQAKILYGYPADMDKWKKENGYFQIVGTFVLNTIAGLSCIRGHLNAKY